MTKTFETFDMIRELVNNKTVRDQAWVQIKKQAGEYITQTVCLQNSCRYEQGKIAFEVASMFVGIGELKAGLQAAKFTKLLKAVDNISDQIKVIHRAIHGLGGKFVKSTTKGVVDVLSATGTKIAKVTNGLIEPLAQYITTDPSKKVVRRLNGVKYKLPNSTQEVTGDIELVDGGGCEGLRLNAETQVAACNLLWRVVNNGLKFFKQPQDWWDFVDNNTYLKKFVGVNNRLLKPSKAKAIVDETGDIKRVYGRTSVCFTEYGFPDMTPFIATMANGVSAIVKIDNMGSGNDRNSDYNKANQKLAALMGHSPNTVYQGTINGIRHVWHHHEDGIHMMLIPEKVNQVAHLGGYSLIKEASLGKDIIGRLPSPSEAIKFIKNCF